MLVRCCGILEEEAASAEVCWCGERREDVRVDTAAAVGRY